MRKEMAFKTIQRFMFLVFFGLVFCCLEREARADDQTAKAPVAEQAVEAPKLPVAVPEKVEKNEKSAAEPKGENSPAQVSGEGTGSKNEAPSQATLAVPTQLPAAAATTDLSSSQPKVLPAKTTKAEKKSSKATPPKPVLSKSENDHAASKKAEPNAKNSSATAASNSKKMLGTTKPLSAYELGRYQYCGDDRDCVRAINGCCDCANGGEDVAVNKERYEAFRERFDCLNVSCSEKAAQPPCASGVTSCVNHKCKYFTNLELDQKF